MSGLRRSVRLLTSSQLGETAKRVAARSSTLKRKVKIYLILNHSASSARSRILASMTYQALHHLIIEDRVRDLETRRTRRFRRMSSLLS